MSATIFSGAALAANIKAGLAQDLAAFKARARRAPSLMIFSAQDSPAARNYLKARLAACRSLGIDARREAVAPERGTSGLRDLLRSAARDESVDAIIVDSPLPGGINAHDIRSAIAPDKDAEGLSAARFGRLFLAKTYAETRALIAPPTARACAEILRSVKADPSGLRALVIGRSPVVGRPAAHLLCALGMTVVQGHSQTRDLEGEVRRADVLVAAAGQSGLVRGDWIKAGAVVIDAGVNEDDGSLRGDVDFEGAAKSASFITPVPGGVGPVTTACLLANIVALAQARADAGP